MSAVWNTYPAELTVQALTETETSNLAKSTSPRFVVSSLFRPRREASTVQQTQRAVEHLVSTRISGCSNRESWTRFAVLLLHLYCTLLRPNCKFPNQHRLSSAAIGHQKAHQDQRAENQLLWKETVTLKDVFEPGRQPFRCPAIKPNEYELNWSALAFPQKAASACSQKDGFYI